METLSGGESVWIKRAIYDAFGIVRDQHTGQRFLTTFMDEMDGALDPESRHRYFQMIQAAHQESGRTHTVVVTHSEQAQEFIPQRVVMTELQASVREVVA
jgi:ABC-type lipoprotein export system ATPase subunit